MKLCQYIATIIEVNLISITHVVVINNAQLSPNVEDGFGIIETTTGT
jgi:hypothetical protein